MPQKIFIPVVRMCEKASMYSAQPPLYTWLLWPLVQIVGANVVALALLKLILLASLYWLMTRLGRHALGEERGVLASVTPLLVPVIAWEAWRKGREQLSEATASQRLQPARR